VYGNQEVVVPFCFLLSLRYTHTHTHVVLFTDSKNVGPAWNYCLLKLTVYGFIPLTAFQASSCSPEPAVVFIAVFVCSFVSFYVTTSLILFFNFLFQSFFPPPPTPFLSLLSCDCLRSKPLFIYFLVLKKNTHLCWYFWPDCLNK
jgi:hypothetical protein